MRMQFDPIMEETEVAERLSVPRKCGHALLTLGRWFMGSAAITTGIYTALKIMIAVMPFDSIPITLVVKN